MIFKILKFHGQSLRTLGSDASPTPKLMSICCCCSGPTLTICNALDELCTYLFLGDLNVCFTSMRN